MNATHLFNAIAYDVLLMNFGNVFLKVFVICLYHTCKLVAFPKNVSKIKSFIILNSSIFIKML